MTRFGRWTEQEDLAKAKFLSIISRRVSEKDAVARLGPGFTVGDVREWMREDKDFARAVKAARRRRPTPTVIGNLGDYAPGGRLSGNDPPPPGTPDHLIEREGWKKGWWKK